MEDAQGADGSLLEDGRGLRGTPGQSPEGAGVSALAFRTGPCVCSIPGCDREWPRDPMLEVPCPDCGAGIGVHCKRPSGHSGPFVNAHASRDLAADAAGAYGTCPLGRCGIAANGTARSDSDDPPATTIQGAFAF